MPDSDPVSGEVARLRTRAILELGAIVTALFAGAEQDRHAFERYLPAMRDEREYLPLEVQPQLRMPALLAGCIAQLLLGIRELMADSGRFAEPMIGGTDACRATTHP